MEALNPGGMLHDFLLVQIYAFIVVFVRLGTALMIMPGIGDSFVPERVRLLFGLAFAIVLTPVLAPVLPKLPIANGPFLGLLMIEFFIGLFIGTIARIFMSALDTAGMLISIQMGLSNAQIFNPSMATQGSVIGGFLSITGALLLLVTNMHHLLIGTIFESYAAFPPGQLPTGSGDIANLVARAVGDAFMIGFQFSIPFMVVNTIIYVAMGVLARLMPQLQIFMLAMPVQIGVGFLVLVLTMAAGMVFWLQNFQNSMSAFSAGL